MISPLIVPLLVFSGLVAIVSFWATRGLRKSKQRELPDHEAGRREA
jgi:hypothetical protein